MRRQITRFTFLVSGATALAGLVPALVALLLQSLLPLGACLAVGLLGLPLGMLTGWLLTRRHVGRAARLIDGSMELTRGKLGHQVDVGGEDALGTLGQVLNYASQQLMAYDGENRRLYQNLENGTLETMVLIANIIDSKDSLTHGHSQRVGDWATEIGKELGLTPMEVRHLLYGGLLHDIGKIGVIEPILGKKGALTDEEMGAMRAHPQIGVSIIGTVSFLKPILTMVRNHHERWDGMGYPDKLAGESIPFVARIVAVADTWDALTSKRPYQDPMTTEQALKVMENLKNKALDPKVVDALARVVLRKREKGDRVSLADPHLPVAAGTTSNWGS
ncbi:MAG: HD-GYP domain-containing protein [Myxococcales bacterium]